MKVEKQSRKEGIVIAAVFWDNAAEKNMDDK